MPNNQFHTAISTHRFNRYLIACNNNRNKAELLYRTNIRLSQELYAIIGLFEVILRNSIDRHYTQIKGEFWLEDAVEPGGFLDGFGCEDSFHNVQEAIFRLQNKYTHDGLIAQHTFGFWVYLFAPKQYAAAGQESTSSNHSQETTISSAIQQASLAAKQCGSSCGRYLFCIALNARSCLMDRADGNYKNPERVVGRSEILFK